MRRRNGVNQKCLNGKTLLTYFHPMPVPKTKLAMDVQAFEIFHRTGGLICKTLLRCLDQKRLAAIYIYDIIIEQISKELSVVK